MSVSFIHMQCKVKLVSEKHHFSRSKCRDMHDSMHMHVHVHVACTHTNLHTCACTLPFIDLKLQVECVVGGANLALCTGVQENKQ